MLFERIAATRRLKLTVLAAFGAGALAMYQPGQAQNAPVPSAGAPVAAPAAPVFPDAAATDPVAAGWMQGFPPAAAKVISFTPAVT